MCEAQVIQTVDGVADQGCGYQEGRGPGSRMPEPWGKVEAPAEMSKAREDGLLLCV